MKIFALLVGLATTWAKGTTPEQIHLALAGRDADGNSNGMNVAWWTEVSCSSTVRYSLGSTVDNSSPNITNTHAPLKYIEKHGFHHSVTLNNLQGNSTYYYSISDSKGGWSPVHQFKTAPTSKEQAFKMSIFGDWGYLSSKERPMKITHKGGLVKSWSAIPTRTLLEEWKDNKAIDFVWHVGDLGYVDDSFTHKHELLEFSYEDLYNEWMNWVQNLTSVMPYMTLPGNHESECHSPACFLHPKYHKAERNFTAYNYRWHMPSKESGGTASMWYSFNYGPARFIAANTETDFPGAGEEHRGDSGIFPAGHFAPEGAYMDWFEKELAQAAKERDAGNRTWLIVGGHRPWGQNGPTSDQKYTKMHDLMAKYGVDIYFSGHAHSYSRSSPVSQEDVDSGSIRSFNHYHKPNGTTYVVVGGAGCDEMDYSVNPVTLEVNATFRKRQNPKDIVPPHSHMVDSSEYAIGILEVNTTALHWTLYASESHKVIDELWITK